MRRWTGCWGRRMGGVWGEERSLALLAHAPGRTARLLLSDGRTTQGLSAKLYGDKDSAVAASFLHRLLHGLRHDDGDLPAPDAEDVNSIWYFRPIYGQFVDEVVLTFKVSPMIVARPLLKDRAIFIYALNCAKDIERPMSRRSLDA